MQVRLFDCALVLAIVCSLTLHPSHVESKIVKKLIKKKLLLKSLFGGKFKPKTMIHFIVPIPVPFKHNSQSSLFNKGGNNDITQSFQPMFSSLLPDNGLELPTLFSSGNNKPK